MAAGRGIGQVPREDRAASSLRRVEKESHAGGSMETEDAGSPIAHSARQGFHGAIVGHFQIDGHGPNVDAALSKEVQL